MFLSALMYTLECDLNPFPVSQFLALIGILTRQNKILFVTVSPISKLVLKRQPLELHYHARSHSDGPHKDW